MSLIAWSRSTRCDSALCVEVGWRKSTRSAANGNCIETLNADDATYVRDSKDPDGPRLRFSSSTWRAFVDDLRSGQFDRP